MYYITVYAGMDAHTETFPSAVTRARSPSAQRLASSAWLVPGKDSGGSGQKHLSITEAGSPTIHRQSLLLPRTDAQCPFQILSAKT